MHDTEECSFPSIPPQASRIYLSLDLRETRLLETICQRPGSVKMGHSWHMGECEWGAHRVQVQARQAAKPTS